MDGQMHNVEAYMGGVGQRCNNRLLEKKGANLRSWTAEVEAPSTKHFNPNPDFQTAYSQLPWQIVPVIPSRLN